MKLSMWILSLSLFPLSGLPMVAQSQKPPRPPVMISGQGSHQFPEQQRQQQDDESAKIQKENARKANEARQLALKNDTEKLLQLANELQQYVDNTNENILSLEVVRKAEQIEKLAKSVKEKMKANY